MAQARIELWRVLPEVVPVAWPVVEPWLETAISTGMDEYTLEDIHEGIMQGNLQLWAAVNDGVPTGCAVTQLLVLPQRTVCLIFALGGIRGQLGAMFALQDQLEAWALSEGATILKAFVRPGLFKKLKLRGFSQQKYLVAKDLKRSMH